MRFILMTVIISVLMLQPAVLAMAEGTVTVSGVVIDSKGQPVQAATVYGPAGASTTTDFQGAYSFTVPVGSSGSVWPKKSGIVFFPGSRSISNVQSSRQGLDFAGASLPPVQILSSTRTFNFNAYEGSTPMSQETRIGFYGAGWNTQAIAWTAVGSSDIVYVSPSSGTGPGPIYVWVDTSGLAPGSYDYGVTISSPDARLPLSLGFIVTVYPLHQQATPPFGSFDTPAGGAKVSGSVPLTGWVLDDVAVTGVKLYRGEVGNSEFVGDAVFVEGARPDVEGQYPDSPQNQRAAWGYNLLTNMLPNGGNGTFTFYAEATDSSNNKTVLGSKTLTVNNESAVKPFGSIDTPTQGGTASGSSFAVNGWVLTPMPDSIPDTGSAINVYIDGAPAGPVMYGIARSDIAQFFPGYANSDAAGAYFALDTTGYDNGMHTIQWTARDSGGESDGIGSRFFSITNSGSRSKRLSPPDAPQKKMYARSSTTPDEYGKVYIDLASLFGVSSGFFDACLLSGEQSRYLPVGARVTSDGQFTWDPGPITPSGDWEFQFQHVDENGQYTERTQTVSFDSDSAGFIPAVPLLLLKN